MSGDFLRIECLAVNWNNPVREPLEAQTIIIMQINSANLSADTPSQTNRRTLTHLLTRLLILTHSDTLKPTHTHPDTHSYIIYIFLFIYVCVLARC